MNDHETGPLQSIEAIRREMASRCDAIEQQIASGIALMAEIRSLLGDVEVRQHGAASMIDELKGMFRDAERRQHIAASLADEMKGKFRDIEVRELEIQRLQAIFPELIQEIVADEINRMDGYNRYALDRLSRDLRVSRE